MIAWWLAGCSLSGPSVSLEGAELTELGWEQVAADVSVRVHNPLPFEIPVESWSWSVSVAGHRLGGGEELDGGVLAAGASTVLVVPVVVRTEDLATLTALPEDVVPYRVEGVVTVGTPFGARDVPFAHEGYVPRPELPEWRVVDWDATLQGTSVGLVTTLEVELPEGFSLGVMNWTLHAGERPVAAGSLAAPSGTTVVVPAAIDVREVGGVAMDLLRDRASPSSRWVLAVDGVAHTPLGTLPISVRRELGSSTP